MSYNLKKITFFASFNISLFCFLMLGIQNSSEKMKVNLMVNQTIALPISFTIGTSFIIGSMIGSLISFNYSFKNKG
tara:strand:+ start:104 stop:331 length:228 start_codon:yes stop_codon:yes gene_type:complete